MAASLRNQAIRIFRRAVEAAQPERAVLDHLTIADGYLVAGRKRYRLGRFRNVYVIGAGKAALRMARAVERLLGQTITVGLINIPESGDRLLRRIATNRAGHPVPDRNGERGAKRIADIARKADADDLIVCLISGGASAMLPLPASPVTLAEKQETTRLLLACGADIHEMNCVRKHISALKGGQFARLAYPATVLTLLLSDIMGDDLDVIGSGPTVPDRSTNADARAVLAKFGLQKRVPASVATRLADDANETPKAGDRVFERVQNVLIGSNRMAVEAAAGAARELGFRTMILSTHVQGEAREVARVYAGIAREIRTSGHPLRPPACIVSGGETTVTLSGSGRGGRNQELALAAALALDRLDDVLLLSAGTDGIDGPTDAAGATVDGNTIARAKRAGVDAAAALANHDSYRFFAAVGDHIKTGATGTNVADVQIILVR